jgi:hypothetical protein
MFHRVRNKMLVVSLSLATAGILACLGALFDSLVADGSILTFLAATVPLGLAIVGVLAGFAWLCDKCESYLRWRVAGRLTRTRHRVRSTPMPGFSRTASSVKKWHGQ